MIRNSPVCVDNFCLSALHAIFSIKSCLNRMLQHINWIARVSCASLLQTLWLPVRILVASPYVMGNASSW